MISGTIYNTLKLQTLTNQWQQKKESGNVLSKKELNKRAEWTEADWMKQHFQEQLTQEKEVEKKNAIDYKIMSGETLTPEEEQYLRENNPQALERYRETKREKKSYEEKLRNCKTKDEVQRLKYNTISGYLSSFKKIENNPNISLGEKLAKAQEMLGKTRNIQKAEREFMTTDQYRNMPTEVEQAVEREEERSAENKQMLDGVEESIEANDKGIDREIHKENDREIHKENDREIYKENEREIHKGIDREIVKENAADIEVISHELDESEKAGEYHFDRNVSTCKSEIEQETEDKINKIEKAYKKIAVASGIRFKA